MAVAVDRTCSRCGAQHGRPHLARAGLEVSVAHSGDVAAVATADRVVVGVDVEEIRPIDYPGLLDDVCSAAERENVKDLTTFLRTWTRKESLLKATGDGLAVVLSDLVLAPGESSATLVRYPGREGLEATIRDVELRPGYVAAVTALTWRPLHVGVNPASALLARPVRRNRSGIDGHAARR
jgi:4'-phosphopantetheinyl transferase